MKGDPAELSTCSSCQMKLWEARKKKHDCGKAFSGEHQRPHDPRSPGDRDDEDAEGRGGGRESRPVDPAPEPGQSGEGEKLPSGAL